jgi:DNA-binding winged helix-turn-helix (wHTH) protein
MSFPENDLVKFDEYEIDRARWQLSWRDEPLSLNRKTFDLLLYLVDHADRVVGKDELLRTLWPGSFVEESNLTQHIFLLRKALSRHESGTKMIETVSGRGYRFAATLKEQPATNQTTVTSRESVTRITVEEELETQEPGFPGRKVVHPVIATPSASSRLYWIAGGSLCGGLVWLAALARSHGRCAGAGGANSDGGHDWRRHPRQIPFAGAAHGSGAESLGFGRACFHGNGKADGDGPQA